MCFILHGARQPAMQLSRISCGTIFSLCYFASVALAQDAGSQDWSSQCESRVRSAWQAASDANGTSSAPPYPHLVGPWGNRVPGVTPDDAWGITYAQCLETCQTIESNFHFDAFSASFTNWLLPWLALIAQLPFETDGNFNNIMSMLLAVGSPALITYSLAITIFNRARIAQKFEQLKTDAKNSLVKRVYHQFIQRLDIACYVLQESQQAPMRAWEGNGWLSSLILMDANQGWWEGVHKHLASTKRTVTTSLIAQVLFAVVAWLFTIIASFDSLGDPTTALSISASGIWLWMIPVIAGWVAVGTQDDKDTVADALEGTSIPCFRAQPADQAQRGIPKPKPGSQDGIRAISGILSIPPEGESAAEFRESPHDAEAFRQSSELQGSSSSDDMEVPTSSSLRRARTVNEDGEPKTETGITSGAGGSDPVSIDFERIAPKRVGSFIYPSLTTSTCHLPRMWSIDLNGHESEQGPIYNYARVFTAARFADTVIYGFEEALKNIANGKSPTGQWRRYDETGKRVDLQDNLAGTVEQYARFCGFDKNPEVRESYASWRAVNKKVWRHILVSSIVALFVLWGTTGPSVLIGMTTPAAGLGCRSGSYVLYGCLATASFLFLAAASLMSHGIMLRYQRGRSLGRVAAATFVLCKALGSCLATINAIWLVLSSVFELAGIFDTCFCSADYIGLGQQGWVLLFKTADDLAASAQSIWVGAIAFGTASCIISCVFVWLGCKGNS